MSVLYRQHRGSLSESMKTVVEVNSIDDIYNHSHLSEYGIKNEGIEISPYGYDERINWDTYIVTKKDYGVLGFTNGELGKKEIG